MAKIGEGDPRWIVNERTDGQNVNSWHWEEKDLTASTHKDIKSMFDGVTLYEDGTATITAKEVSEISGDVTVAQRKGKIMCYFDLKMTIKWKGLHKASEKKKEGKMSIHEIEHDNFRDEFDIDIHATDTGAEANELEAVAKKTCRPVIREKIAKYFEELYVKYSVGKNMKSLAAGQAAGSPGTPATGASSEASTPAKKPVPSTPTGEPTSFQWKMDWRCNVEDLWAVLTDQGRIQAYTRAPVKIDPRPAGEFNFLGGVISGFYVDVKHLEKISMQWRLDSWPSGTFSNVVMKLEKEDIGVTRLAFEQTNIVSGDLEKVKKGWMVNFFDPIKMLFGYSLEFK